MGSGAWQLINNSLVSCGGATPFSLGCSGHTFTNGNAQFIWDGVYGHTYELNYTATIPAGDPSGASGSPYFLHLEGIVNQAAVPVQAAVWLFGSGMMGLGVVARRKRRRS